MSDFDWQSFNREILDKLDILSEYKAVGIETVGRPNARGWIACRAYGQEKDRKPSAGINVGSNHPERGRYKEFVGSGRNLSLFEFLATANAPGSDKGWEGVRDELAKKLGMDVPKKQKKKEDKALVFQDWNFSLVDYWCRQHKKGVSPYAVQAAGGQLAMHYDRFPVIAIPVYGVHLRDSDPCGWVAYALNGKDLPIFQGKDRPPLWRKVKTISGSESGMLNAYGLGILESAELVWTPEGLSDMLTLQSFVPRSEIKKQAVISNSGGAMEIFRPEMAKNFSGKRVIVPVDCDLAGWGGGWRRAREIAEYASEVRVWRPPFRIVAKHGPDVRDYITGAIRPCSKCLGTGNLSQVHDDVPTDIEELKLHVLKERGDCLQCDGLGIPKPESPEDFKMPLPTFESLLIEALECPVITKSQQGHDEKSLSTVDMEVERSICDMLGIIVVERLSTREFTVWSKEHKDYFEVNTTHLSYEDLLSTCGPIVKSKVHLGKEAVPGMVRMYEVKNAIAVMGGYCGTSGSSYGRGCWPGHSKNDPLHKSIVLVGAREAAVWNGKGVLEKHETPFVDGLAVNIGNDESWFDFEKLSSYLDHSKDRQWCSEQVDRLIALLEKWYWKQKSAPEITAGLVLSTWVQTLWQWRPLVSLVGSSDSGKTRLFQTLERIFGSLSLMSSKSNDVGLRQAIGNQACVVLCDEFESDQYRRKILEFFRTASQGSRILRGSNTQKGVSFGLKHICWVAAVEVGMEREPDKNRFISLELARPAKDKRGKLKLPSPSELNDFGQRLLAVAMRNFHQAKQYAEELQTMMFPGIHGRMVESLAVPVAMLAATCGLSLENARDGLFPNIIAGFAIEDEKSVLDEAGLMHAILSSHIDLGRGEKITLGQILSDTSDVYERYASCVERSGITVTKASGFTHPHLKVSRDGPETLRVLFVAHEAVKRYLMRGTAWEYQAIDQILQRLPGAERSRRRIAGQLSYGVCIPLDYIDREFIGELHSSDAQQAELEFI